MILILVRHWGRANGVLTSIIDLYNNLVKYKDVTLKITTENIGEFLLLCKKNDNFGYKSIMSCITNKTCFEADTIITSVKTLNEQISMNCRKLILLDSLDIAKSYYGLIPPLKSICDNTILLCNPANAPMTSFDTIPYFHKFSPERLQTVKIGNVSYKRHDKPSILLKDGVYFESIGKVIFEAIYAERSVEYYGCLLKDGLYHYLKLFGVDGEKSYKKLPITKNDIKRHLFMKQNDEILEMI